MFMGEALARCREATMRRARRMIDGRDNTEMDQPNNCVHKKEIETERMIGAEDLHSNKS